MFKLAVEATKDCIAKIPANIPCINYTWNRENKPDESEDTTPFSIHDGNGREIDSPIRLVCFIVDAEKGYDHETCYISLDSDGFDFCKTAQPYDVAVCITLIVF